MGSAAMAEADVVLTSVARDAVKLGHLIPSGSMSKQDGKSALAGKWKLPNADGSVTLEVSGKSVKSVETFFGNQPLMGEIEESEDVPRLHITMGGFPMKAWLKNGSGSTVLAFSNSGKWI